MHTDDRYFQICRRVTGSEDQPVFVEEVQDEVRALHRVDLLNLRLSAEEEAAGWVYYISNPEGTFVPAGRRRSIAISAAEP